MKPEILSVLKELEKISHLYWNVPPEVGQFLNLFIKDRKYKSVFEIGTSNGYSGIWLAEGLSHTGGILYTIESHKKDRYQLAQENFKKSGLTNHITSLLGHAPQDIPTKPEFFDMAFFDATKHEHEKYFNALKNRINAGGAIITDNINSHRKDLKGYIKTVKKDPDWESVELDIGAGLLISIRR